MVELVSTYIPALKFSNALQFLALNYQLVFRLLFEGLMPLKEYKPLVIAMWIFDTMRPTTNITDSIFSIENAPEADVVESLIVNAEGLVSVLHQLVDWQGGVVGLHHGVGHLHR